MTTPENEATILRLHHGEGWPVGTIASQLGIHHSIVRRVIEQEGAPDAARSRCSKADSHVPFIIESLKRYPRLTAVRLFQMVRERGYDGRQDHFRSIVARYRPKPSAEAFLRLKTLPGKHEHADRRGIEAFLSTFVAGIKKDPLEEHDPWFQLRRPRHYTR